MNLPAVILPDALERQARANLRAVGEGLVPVYRTIKMDELKAAWQHMAFSAFTAAVEAESTVDLQRYATVMGIATDKLMVLSGMPTQIVANVHEHRVNLVEIAEKLVRAVKAPAVIEAGR